MAFQMAITIGIGVFVGQKLDERFQFEKPVLTATGALLGLFVAFYMTLKDLIVPPKK